MRVPNDFDTNKLPPECKVVYDLERAEYPKETPPNRLYLQNGDSCYVEGNFEINSDCYGGLSNSGETEISFYGRNDRLYGDTVHIEDGLAYIEIEEDED